MKILIIGGGGREHALAWKIAESNHVNAVFVAPGNAGTALEPKTTNIDIDPMDFPRLIEFVQSQFIDLTLIGPEAPLAAGIVDTFKSHHQWCFGPHQIAAQLEASKGFSKDFMTRHHIPTAPYQRFRHANEAHAYLKQQPLPIVIKADGLAAGKGVTVAYTHEQASAAIDDCLQKNQFGEAGTSIVIEAYLPGPEASYMVIADGEDYLPLPTSCDHKARDDRGKGPNTGGMGAYSPAPLITPTLEKAIQQTIIEPTLKGLLREGIYYTGFLYAGLKINPNGNIHVLEFNCRLGDPETEVIVMRLQTDFIDLLLAAKEHRLHQMKLTIDPLYALGVVLTENGYPGDHQKGHVIQGIDIAEGPNTKIFHGGTKKDNQLITTNGGRVLCVTAKGATLPMAQQLAYQIVHNIHWPGMHHRHDIGATTDID